MPPEETVPPGTWKSEPSGRILSTEIVLLPASTAITNLPSAVAWIAPCEPMSAPLPAPPVANGEPTTDVSDPSTPTVKAAIVFDPAVLSLTYRCVTCVAALAVSEAPVSTPTARAERPDAAASRSQILITDVLLGLHAAAAGHSFDWCAQRPRRYSRISRDSNS